MYYLKHLIPALILGSIIGISAFWFLADAGVLDGKPVNTIRTYVITSGSMEPAIPVGSVVISQSTDTYKIGDIVTFSPGEDKKHHVTHRIVNIEGETITTKGDANEEADMGSITMSQISGKTLFSIPYVGHAVEFAKTPKGFVALIIIPATIVIYEELKTVLNEIKKVLKSIFKRGEASGGKQSKGYWRAAVALPLVLLGFVVTLSTAYFTDIETTLGNTLGISTTYGTSPSPSSTSSPTPSIVINEFMPRPDQEDEWVELYNPTDQTISLVGWALDEGDQNPKTLDHLGSILPNSFVVYEHTSANWLDNAGETLELLLLNPSSQVVDSYTYTSTTEGVSIGRETDGAALFAPCLAVSKGTTNNNVCGVNP